MFTKAIVFAILAACGVTSNSPEPDEIEPPDDQQVDQHFCCQSVHAKPWGGEGCTAIAKEHINTCAKVLYCSEKWINDDGGVTCE